MLFELCIGGFVWAGAELIKRKDDEKKQIDRIFRKCGLSVKYNQKEEVPKLLGSKKSEHSTEYIYRIPEGLSFKDFEKKKDVIETSLNSNSGNIDINDIKKMNINGNIKGQFNAIRKAKNQRKEITLAYDKVLSLRVYYKPLTNFLPYANDCKGWQVPVGSTITTEIKHDFEKIMHMVVAGTTRYGKSVFLKNVITTLITNQPENSIFTLIDLKGGLTFNRFSSCPQVRAIADHPKQSLEVLERIDKEMDEVMGYLKSNKFENVIEASLPSRHFIIIDEAAELSPGIERDKELRAIKNKCEVILSRIARIGGALGYRLIYATQTPYSEVLNHNIKQNCDAKLCFRLQTDKASEVVLGEGITSAGHLPYIKGRAIYLTDREHVVQTPMIENEYIERVINDV